MHTIHSLSTEPAMIAMLDDLPDGVLVVDSEGVVRYANPAACTLLGTGLENMLGRHFTIPADGPVEIKATGDRLVRLRVAPSSLDGKHATLICLDDVTERRYQEARSRNKIAELAERARAANIAEITSGAMHNIGNVLNSAAVSIDQVLDEVRSARVHLVRKAAGLLEQERTASPELFAGRDAIERLPEFLRTLADHLEKQQQAALREVEFLRKTMGHVRTIITTQQRYAGTAGETERATVGEVLDIALDLERGALETAGIQLDTHGDTDASVEMDRNKLLQILLNLLSNARHAVAEVEGDRRIAVTTTVTDDQRVRLAVSDNGKGIPPDELERVFHHGFTTRESGHGFGLPSCKQAVTEMSGTLGVHSDGVGKGATFVLELPKKAPKPERRVPEVPRRSGTDSWIGGPFRDRD